jgi:hypothetical protein
MPFGSASTSIAARLRSRLFTDEEGDELEPERVQEHALTVAKDLIRNVRSSTIRDWFDCSFRDH